jgi:hypothetical protein
MQHPQFITIEIASRPARGDPVSGDSWQVAWLETACRVALVRGEGGGLAAANGATVAIAALAHQPRLDPARAVARCHEELNTTRGAAAFVTRIDAAARAITVSGEGNVAVWFCREAHCHQLMGGGEIAAGSLGPVSQIELPLGDEWLLVVYADADCGRWGDGLAAALATPEAPRAVPSAVRAAWSGIPADAMILLVHPR